ncbi:HAD hydrolase-like protein [Veillonella sp. R32]|uniref:HAD hydrolase-like protein n=1 Tax=Veillonella sp. R32 TaxID=2021312 RepID=UPI0013895A65|nr:HAD hydrolase-like protein [Veillonella sp. R32]KAF1679378.1 phosphoglycolate phosphatase [Veillonella sp. R32]
MICVLFDLDGTLTDSAEGIKKSVVYALEKKGVPVPSDEILTLFIGPPIVDSLREHCGMTEAEADETYGYFKERYHTIGKFENKVYEDVERMLVTLRQTNTYVAVATAKPEPLAKEVLEHFGLTKYFEIIKGADAARGMVHKEDILKEALADMKEISSNRTKKEITGWYMVGDRKYDVEAAKKLGCRAVAVTYGYGTQAELEAAGADYICHTPSDVILNIAVDTLL